MTIKRIFALGILFVFASALSPARAESGELPTKSITVFKNGLGFFTREGEVKLTNGWATSDIVPPAALGTFWVGSPKSGIRIERLVASWEDITRKVPVTTVQQILSANVGKKMRFNIGNQIVTGTLIALPESKTSDLGQPGYPSPYSYRLPVPAETSLALIKTGETTLAINRGSISSVEIDGEVTAERSIQERAKRLKFKVSGARDKAPVTMAYLQKGISWSPAYLLELLDDKRARLTMQGLLVNDVEDIGGTDVYFAVGYPNFLWADIVSPLMLTQSLTDFINSLSGQGPRYSSIAAQSMANSSLGYEMGPAAPTGPQFSYSGGSNLPGANEEDLFIYTINNVELMKGERAYYTVFSAEVPYEHIYTWDAPDISAVSSSGSSSSNARGTESTEGQVWHKLLLTNNTNYPWTTAPGMAISNGQPISQDTLNYVARRANGELKITVATDIKVRQDEAESSRDTTRHRIYWNDYFKVNVKGRLTVTNLKAKPVTVSIRKTLTGEVIDAAAGADVKKTVQSIRAVNPTSQISWKVPLAPGEEKNLDYTYYTYVRY